MRQTVAGKFPILSINKKSFLVGVIKGVTKGEAGAKATKSAAKAGKAK
jgi:hypothetical protein